MLALTRRDGQAVFVIVGQTVVKVTFYPSSGRYTLALHPEMEGLVPALQFDVPSEHGITMHIEGRIVRVASSPQRNRYTFDAPDDVQFVRDNIARKRVDTNGLPINSAPVGDFAFQSDDTTSPCI